MIERCGFQRDLLFARLGHTDTSTANYVFQYCTRSKHYNEIDFTDSFFIVTVLVSRRYTSGTTVTEFVSDGSPTFARVVTGNSPGGRWILRESDIAGLTPEQIADNFALPAVPTGITYVTPPAGTRIQTGLTRPQTWEDGIPRPGGGTQYELLDKLTEGWSDVTSL